MFVALKVSTKADPGTTSYTHDFRLPPWVNEILPSSGLLRNISWFKTDISGLFIRFHFQGSNCPISLTLEDGTYSLETPVLIQLRLCNNPEDRRTELHIHCQAKGILFYSCCYFNG